MAIPDGSEDMFTIESRLQTFLRRPPLSKSTKSKKVGWPHPPTFQATPETLAAAGFFYKAYNSKSAKIVDEVECFMCRHTLGGWEEKDDPFEEHAARIDQTNCPWAISICSLRQDKDDELGWIFRAEHRLPTSRFMEAARQATYANKWPHDGVRGHGVTSKKMAKAGFVYTPTEMSNDMGRCPYCKTGFDAWEPKDNPLALHQKKRPDCPMFTASLYVEDSEEDEQPAPSRTSSRKTSTKAPKKKPSSASGASKLSSEPSSDTRVKRSMRATLKSQATIEEEPSDHVPTEQEDEIEELPPPPPLRKARSRTSSQTALSTTKSKSSSSKSKKPVEAPVLEHDEEEEDVPPKASSSQSGTSKPGTHTRTQSRTQPIPSLPQAPVVSKGHSKTRSQPSALQIEQEEQEIRVEPAPLKLGKKGKQKTVAAPPPPPSPPLAEDSEDELAADLPPPAPKARSTRAKKATPVEEVPEEVVQMKKSRAVGATTKKKGKTQPPVEEVVTEDETAAEEPIPEEVHTSEPEDDEVPPPTTKSKAKGKTTKGKIAVTKKKGKPAATVKRKGNGKTAAEDEEELVDSQLEETAENRMEEDSEVSSAGEESPAESAMDVDDTAESGQEQDDEPMPDLPNLDETHLNGTVAPNPSVRRRSTPKKVFPATTPKPRLPPQPKPSTQPLPLPPQRPPKSPLRAVPAALTNITAETLQLFTKEERAMTLEQYIKHKMQEEYENLKADGQKQIDEFVDRSKAARLRIEEL